MAGTNFASQFSSDIEQFIQDKTMPLVQRQLVAYKFGDPLRLPKNRGTTYTASRYDRVPLPFAPLSEGVPPIGETMPLAQVSATAQQWGDKIAITDVAELTIKHPLFQKAIELCGMAMAETLERNTFNTLLAGTQIDYVGSVGSRAALGSGNVLSPFEIIRATANMATLGAPMYDGQEQADYEKMAGKPSMASSNPRMMPHYVALIHPLSASDFRQNSTVQTAWSYSDINRLYNFEIGEWGGIRFCQSNLVPFFVGVAAVTGTGSTTGGTLAANTYYIQVTGSPSLTSQEQRIYQVSGAITTTGSTSSISVTTPNVPGYVFNVYIGTSVAPVNLATSTSGPTSGPLTGQATQLAPNTTVVLTGVGISQTPPAAPATGVTVYPTFVLGKNAYGQVMLDDPKFTYLKGADKSDPLNQLRVIGWKVFYGTLIENQNFFMRIEAASAFSGTFG
jgi:N4-gp56 family major capsid protein